MPAPIDLSQLQAQALVQEFSRLATTLAQAPKESRGEQQEPGFLVMRSGVSPRNDLVVGRFEDRVTADLCGQFLMALDRVFQPEFARFEVVDSLD